MFPPDIKGAKKLDIDQRRVINGIHFIREGFHVWEKTSRTKRIL
jgi:hypothetical protein